MHLPRDDQPGHVLTPARYALIANANILKGHIVTLRDVPAAAIHLPATLVSLTGVGRTDGLRQTSQNSQSLSVTTVACALPDA
jgi:hypothetical protein